MGVAERRGRQALRPALLALLLAAALAWASSRVAWVRVTAVDDLRGTRTTTLTGGSWAPELSALALATLAAGAAVLAVRGWLLRVVAVLIAALGAAAALPAVQVLTGGAPAARARTLLDSPTAQLSADTSAVGPGLALGAAVLVVFAGFVVARAPRHGRGLSDRYQSPAVRREHAVANPVDPAQDDVAQRRLWDALDAGQDPTLDPVGESPHPASTVGPDPSPDPGKRGQSR